MHNEMIDRIKSMTSKERIVLARDVLHSDEHLLKVFIGLKYILDPDNAHLCREWVADKLSRQASSG